MKIPLIIVIVLAILIGTGFVLTNRNLSQSLVSNFGNAITNNPSPSPSLHPLAIERMKQDSYPGSDLVIEETLPKGSNYTRYIASYKSEGLKIYGLLAIPDGEPPAGGFPASSASRSNAGWPAIIFNHGFIPPDVYRPTERYIAYVDNFARNGFVVFRPDYRGHGDSEGQPSGAYFSPGYTVDVLNAFSSVAKRSDVNPKRIGMWGHSMGGTILQRSMVINPDIKAGVIWGGVVGTYEDMFKFWWNKRRSPNPMSLGGMNNQQASRSGRSQFIARYGEAKNSDPFWYSISPANFVKDISGPIQLHHGLNDETVPWQLSESMKNILEKEGKEVEYYTYPGGDHDISDPNFSLAINRSIDFFKKYL